MSLCPIQSIFNVSCFGCGLTRGFIAILHFDFCKATEYNVLSIPLFISVFMYVLFSFTDIIFDKNYIEAIESQLLKKYMYVLYVGILIIAYIFNN